jgi:hypothetical protein
VGHIYSVSRAFFLAPACRLWHPNNDLATKAARHFREYRLRRKWALTTGLPPHQRRDMDPPDAAAHARSSRPGPV